MSKIMFLPDNYQAPKNNNLYTKLQDGENKFRILTQPILGWEDWIDKKPVRFRMEEKPEKPHDIKKPIKHFWSMVVWNYTLERIEIFHITQASIRYSIESLYNDSDWGAPYFYDIKITRKGEGMDTEYIVNPIPHKKLNPAIEAAFKDKPVWLEALFDNSDPFSIISPSHITPGVFGDKQDEVVSLHKTITTEQAKELKMILEECERKYYALVLVAIKKEFSANTIEEIPEQHFERIKTAAVQHMEHNHSKQRQEAAS